MITRNLLWAVLASSIFSLLTATIFFILDAVDVSLTEAAVGAGIATILFIFTLKHLDINLKESKSNNTILGLSLVVIVLLVFNLMDDFPNFGESKITQNSNVTEYYLENSNSEMGIPNVVTSILAGYRAFDTLGEVIVIFIAGVSVIGILREEKENE